MNNKPSETILVTGAGGFIGSHMVRRLLGEGADVTILVKPETDLWRLNDVRDRLKIVHASLLDPVELRTALQEIRPKGVYHFAASNISSGVTAADSEVLNVNLLGTKHLIDNLGGIGYSFLVQTGSFTEYGPKNHAVAEDELCAPTELYSISKLGATLYGQAVARQQNKPIVTLRIFTPYGPRMQAERLVSSVARKVLLGQEIEVANPEITRDFIFIDDIIDLCLCAAERAKEVKGEVFNCGNGIATTLKEIVSIIMSLTDSTSNIKWGMRPVLEYDATVWQADMDKVFRKLSWQPSVNLEQGLDATIKWIKESMSI